MIFHSNFNPTNTTLVVHITQHAFPFI